LRNSYQLEPSLVIKDPNLNITYSSTYDDLINELKFNGPYKTTATKVVDSLEDYLMNELEYKMNLVVDNYPIAPLRPFLLPIKNTIKMPKLENKNHLYKYILENDELHNLFKNDIYYKGTVLDKMEQLKKLKPNSSEYQKLYQNIIRVGEYPVQSV
jgi:hypothetical protein